MRVKVLAFGIAKEILGTNRLVVEFDGNTSGALKHFLERQFPLLKELPAYMLAVNTEYVLDETAINHNDEIAIIPPVSGG